MKLVLFTWFTVFALTGLVTWLWVTGIQKMNDEYPDYKGEDFFDEQ